jgi:hypothetical protein
MGVAQEASLLDLVLIIDPSEPAVGDTDVDRTMWLTSMIMTALNQFVRLLAKKPDFIGKVILQVFEKSIQGAPNIERVDLFVA